MQDMNDLIERALHGEASEAEVARLAKWRRAAPENEQHYRRTQRLIAAARARRGAELIVPPPPRAAEIVAGVRAGRSSRLSARARRVALHWAPWAVAAAAVLFVVVRPRGDAPAPIAWAPTEITTGTAELATVKLADGTVVRLAPSSRLQLDATRAREVKLDGRAFFAVTKLAGQAFRVHTRAATANVLGTRFELATDARGVYLRVLEGRVALSAPENSVQVSAGEQSGVRHGTATTPTPVAGADRVPAWLGKFLVFQATPLRDATREIELMYGVRVVVREPALVEATITASFTDRSAEDVIGVVCAVLNAHCTAQDGVVTMIR